MDVFKSSRYVMTKIRSILLKVLEQSHQVVIYMERTGKWQSIVQSNPLIIIVAYKNSRYPSVLFLRDYKKSVCPSYTSILFYEKAICHIGSAKWTTWILLNRFPVQCSYMFVVLFYYIC